MKGYRSLHRSITVSMKRYSRLFNRFRVSQRRREIFLRLLTFTSAVYFPKYAKNSSAERSRIPFSEHRNSTPSLVGIASSQSKIRLRPPSFPLNEQMNKLNRSTSYLHFKPQWNMICLTLSRETLAFVGCSINRLSIITNNRFFLFPTNYHVLLIRCYFNLQ